MDAKEAEEARRFALVAARAEARAMEKRKNKVKFLTKAEREAAALQRLHAKRSSASTNNSTTSSSSSTAAKFQTKRLKHNESTIKKSIEPSSHQNNTHSAAEIQAIKESYLGKKSNPKKSVKASEKFAKVFKFEWEASEDTNASELDTLYASRTQSNLMFGRGYRAGVDLRDQRSNNTYVSKLAAKRLEEASQIDQASNQYSSSEISSRNAARATQVRALESAQASKFATLDAAEQRQTSKYRHWSEKSRDEMTDRDWRIFREDYDIRIKGASRFSVPPLRSWEEGRDVLPSAIIKAITDMKFTTPSPIQMQAIPIGLSNRDVIGIAETGSGKTAAFVIPMITYIYALPAHRVDDAPEQGPLALVLAPTRELALQIESETQKLVTYTSVGSTKALSHRIKTVSVVGGQSIETQGFKLREGVEIVIGTPGRLMDCLESRYLVLNQCNYVVLDEADRMIDMGFESQVETVLNSMGGLLKSENEEELAAQLNLATSSFRTTTMFSATMPPEVERLAKTYLRHPVIVKIGDEDSGKNKRITQDVMFMHRDKKPSKVVEILTSVFNDSKSAKVIVFINLKKACDGVAKNIRNKSYKFHPTVLHGGKSQDQREESLDKFRSGDFNILVATDVAGRGLDIPNVTHVINYDVPTKIENYCHRIGRTGRAGKDGTAISFLTEDDTEIMFDLKNYLTSTDAKIPAQLASHPMAKAAYGERDERGNLISTAVKKH